jgi:hypothetical protein
MLNFLVVIVVPVVVLVGVIMPLANASCNINLPNRTANLLMALIFCCLWAGPYFIIFMYCPWVKGLGFN